MSEDVEQEILISGLGTDSFKEGSVATYKIFIEDEWGRTFTEPELRISIDDSPYFPIDISNIQRIKERLLKKGG